MNSKCALLAENVNYENEDKVFENSRVKRILKIIEDMHDESKSAYDNLEMSLLRDIKQIECYAIKKCYDKVNEFLNGSKDGTEK